MIIYGKNTVLESLKNKTKGTILYTTRQNVELVERFKPNMEIKVVEQKELDKLCLGNHQGLAMVINDYKYTPLTELLKSNKDKQNVSLCILDGLEDPHNLGAILRSADATMVDGIIIPKNRSVGLNEVVAKVSTGAIEHVKVCQETNLVQTIKTLKDNGYWIIGVELGGDTDFRKQDYSGKTCVVIGSEGKGISRLVKENCDFLVQIPMYGHVNSLNASVSAALIFYEMLKVREG